MGTLGYEERLCERFLQNFQNWADPTWGFYVYGTYTRPQGQRDTEGASDEDMVQEAADDARFQAVLSKLHAHTADNLRYGQPAPYNQQLIDTLRLQPAAYLPGASLADVCTHFRQHYAVIIDPERMYDPDYQDTIDSYKCGPKYHWCLVIDDEVLQSIESSLESIGPTPPEGADPDDLAYQAEKASVKLLSKSYTTMENPIVLAAPGRGGSGRRTEWNGWLKFSLVDFMRVFSETDSGDDIKTYYRGPDKVVEFP